MKRYIPKWQAGRFDKAPNARPGLLAKRKRRD